MEELRKVTRVIDLVVFTTTTLAIAGVFYEGMTQKWYDFVGILVICMDYSFMPATVSSRCASDSSAKATARLRLSSSL